MIFRNKHKYNEQIVSSSVLTHDFVLLLCVCDSNSAHSDSFADFRRRDERHVLFCSFWCGGSILLSHVIVKACMKLLNA
jgi:hypothetical protein